MPRRLVAFSALFLLAVLLGTGCGRYMKLDGEITRVRVVETGGTQNVLIVEFEATNNASVGYIVREAEVEVTVPDREGTVKGDSVSVRDAKVICQHTASLANDCAEPLLTRETIKSGETVQRLVAASFDLSAEQLKNRKSLMLRVRELDRLETEFRESK